MISSVRQQMADMFGVVQNFLNS